MKKFIYTVLAVAMVALCACEHRGKDKDVKFETESASVGIAGTYAGTWAYVKNSDEPVVKQGTVVFEATDDKYVAKVTVTSEDGTLNLSTVTNVVHANDAYQFYNNVGFLAHQDIKQVTADSVQITNYYAPFSGDVLPDKSITIQFAYETPNGRKKDAHAYSFVGSK